MSADPRTGTTDSGVVTIASGDGNTPQTAFTIPSDALFRLHRVKIEYEDAATATTNVELFDDADGTGAGNVSDRRDRFPNIDPDMSVTEEGPYRVFEEDVLAQTGGNQDADVTVTVYGEVLTDLEDMTGFA